MLDKAAVLLDAELPAPVIAVYRDLLKALRERSSDAMLLVDAIIWAIGSARIRMLRSFVSYCWQGLADDLAFATALHVLERYGVVEVVDDRIVINDLTRAAFRWLRVPALNQVLAACYLIYGADLTGVSKQLVNLNREPLAQRDESLTPQDAVWWLSLIGQAAQTWPEVIAPGLRFGFVPLPSGDTFWWDVDGRIFTDQRDGHVLEQLAEIDPDTPIRVGLIGRSGRVPSSLWASHGVREMTALEVQRVMAYEAQTYRTAYDMQRALMKDRWGHPVEFGLAVIHPPEDQVRRHTPIFPAQRGNPLSLMWAVCGDLVFPPPWLSS